VAGFDIYSFTGPGLGGILVDPDVRVVDAGGQFDFAGDDLIIRSGGIHSPESARLYVTTSVPESFTFEAVATFASLPNDFTHLTEAHAFIGVADASGPCAGLFFSKVGVAYAGAVSHSGAGVLSVDSALEILSESSSLIAEGEPVAVRLAADLAAEVVYVFITRAAEIGESGPRLRYILPVIRAADLQRDPAEQTTLSVRGGAAAEVRVRVTELRLGSGLIIPNLPPRADAGADQAVRMCSVVRLDGSGSRDPEGAPLGYLWRLIDAPQGSAFSFEGSDAVLLPLVPPAGFTDKLHSEEAGLAHAADPFAPGDVLVVGGVPYEIAGAGVDVDGFHLLVAEESLPESPGPSAFKVLRQRALAGRQTERPTFFPDKPGLFKVDLTVSDGELWSQPSVTIVNAVESPLSRGVVPDLSFLWRYLSDFWALVEGRERVSAFFSALAEVAAAELFTLWQVDYGKSLRDIGRTFSRRWLHYDLLLAEPLPELTRLRSIRGGITSATPFPLGGLSGVSGATLVLSSPVLPKDVAVRFAGEDPYTAEAFSAELSRRLRYKDARFSVQRVPGPLGELVRIDAPFPFTVSEASTLTVFSAGAGNVHPGGRGVRVGIRTYKVDRSLEGLDIGEGDILSISGEGFVIQRIIDDPSDEYRFQRVVFETDLPLLPGADWQIAGFVTSKLLNFYRGLVAPGDHATLEVFDQAVGVSTLVDVPVIAAAQGAPDRLSLDLHAVDGFIAEPERYRVTLAKVNRRKFVPVDELVMDVPCLQERIAPASEAEVLRQNIDFFVESSRGKRCIRFVSEPGGPDVWEGGPAPDRLWAEVTFVDNRETIEAHFGIPADFSLDDFRTLGGNIDYLSAVRGLWYAHLKGPTLFNLRAGVQILLGLPFAEEAGIIEEIQPAFSAKEGRLLVRDKARPEIVRSYRYPRGLEIENNPSAGRPYGAGDEARQFAPLVRGAEVIDYVSQPRWFEGLLRQGAFFEVEKFFTFLVRVNSRAFKLGALLFVQEFIRRIKPVYTEARFVVLSEARDTEVSATDQVLYRGRLLFFAGACFDAGGVATMFDQPRPAGGGWFSDFDGNADPDDTPVEELYPAVQPVAWGFDKKFLCPDDELIASACAQHAGGAVTFDSVFQFDTGAEPTHVFTSGAVTSVPAGGVVLPGNSLGGPSSVGVGGTLERVSITITGGPGSDPIDYEIALIVSGSPAGVVSFNVGPTGFMGSIPVSGAVLVAPGDTISARLQPASGGTRAPSFSDVLVKVVQSRVPFAFDTPMPEGVYCNTAG
jgi:hypothetical protein